MIQPSSKVEESVRHDGSGKTHWIDGGSDAYSSGDTILGDVFDLVDELVDIGWSTPAMGGVARCSVDCSSSESQRERRDPGGG